MIASLIQGLIRYLTDVDFVHCRRFEEQTKESSDRAEQVGHTFFMKCKKKASNEREKASNEDTDMEFLFA